MYLPLTEIQKRLYLDTLTGRHEHGDFEVDQHDSHPMVTPPQSPGFENYSSQPATQTVSKEAKRQGMTNILMEMRKVSRIRKFLTFPLRSTNDFKPDMCPFLVHYGI
jgi:hypothetical protein